MCTVFCEKKNNIFGLYRDIVSIISKYYTESANAKNNLMLEKTGYAWEIYSALSQ